MANHRASPDDSLSLPRAIDEIERLSGGKRPSYHGVRRAAAREKIPVITLQTGRLFVRRAELPEVARHFGIEIQAPN